MVDSPNERRTGIEIANTGDDAAGSTSTYVFDIEDEMAQGRTCSGVIRVLAEITNAEPRQMQPLHGALNCDALDALFRTRRYGEARDDVSVTFHYDVYEVTVDASGQVAVRE